MNEAAHHGLPPTQKDLTVMVPARDIPGMTLRIPVNRTVIDANLLSWVGGGFSEALPR